MQLFFLRSICRIVLVKFMLNLNCISVMKENLVISFNWEAKTAEDTERVGAMYCFKRCDVNQN